LRLQQQRNNGQNNSLEDLFVESCSNNIEENEIINLVPPKTQKILKVRPPSSQISKTQIVI